MHRQMSKVVKGQPRRVGTLTSAENEECWSQVHNHCLVGRDELRGGGPEVKIKNMQASEAEVEI